MASQMPIMENDKTKTITAVLYAVGTFFAAGTLTGCTLEEAKETPTTPAAPVAITMPQSTPATTADKTTTDKEKPSENPPSTESAAPAMGMASPTAPLTPTPELDAKIAAAEKGSDKNAIAVAYAERGTFRMLDEKAGARIKYRKALADFRKALQSDPANAKAKKGLETIESIYQSMGMPVPQDTE
jgi:hypothetical protein